MLAWIPFIGPVLNAIAGAYGKFKDTQVAKLVSNNATDVAIVDARAKVAIAFKDDPGVKFVRDMIMGCVALWIGLVFWDSCFRNILPTYLTWRILALPGPLEYIPHMVLAFLFVDSWRSK
jgi:hypothetical protein